MNNHSTGFLLVLSVLMFGCQNQPEQQMMNPDGPSTNETADCRTAYPGLVSTIAGHLADAGAPGAAIAIVTNGQLACASGIGMKDVQSETAATGQTLFLINSMSKVFTAAAAMTEVENGTLDLNAPITTYVPSLALAAPWDPSTITMDTLLDHTSGYPNGFEMAPGDMVPYNSPSALPAFFAYYTDIPLWSPPGAVWNYSNFGYALAGLVVSQVAQQEIGDYVQHVVLAPTGMTTATYDPSVAIAGDHATGYAPTGSTFSPEDLSEDTSYFCRPFCGLMASAEDMGHFMEMLLAGGGQTLAASSVQTLTSAHAATGNADVSYGYGLFIEPQPSVTLIEHSGGGTAFVSDFEFIPERQYGFVILVNDGGYSGVYEDRLAARQAVLGLSAYTPSGASTPPTTWARYAGTYFDPVSFGTIQVTVPGDKLHLHFVEHSFDTTCQQADQDSFQCDQVPPWLPEANELSELPLTFFADITGTVRYLATRLGVATRPQ